MSIDRPAYSDQSIFEVELTHLFSSRMYAGSIFDFPSVDDYRSFQIGNRAITIRKTAEGLHAFNNVCLHRNALIDPPGSGNRTFRCNYHGWGYDAFGTLRSAPLVDAESICDRQLTQYPMTQVQGLCFLGLQKSPDVTGIDLALRETHITPIAPFYRSSLEHACNWKLLVENVLEGYHLSYVHKTTFIPAGFTSTANHDCASNGDVSWGKLTPTPTNDRTQAMRRLCRDAGHFYHHAYVFPDLFLSNTNGLIGFQSNLQPIGKMTTRLEWSLFELPALIRLAGPIREQLRADAIRFTTAALLEDKSLVESCQLGLSSIGPPIQLQSCEGRIAHFHAMYRGKVAHVLG